MFSKSQKTPNGLTPKTLSSQRDRQPLQYQNEQQTFSLKKTVGGTRDSSHQNNRHPQIDFYPPPQNDKQHQRSHQKRSKTQKKNGNGDESRSSTSSTTYDRGETMQSDNKIQSLITQVQQDNDRMTYKKGSNANQEYKQSQGSNQVVPMIYEAKYQPSQAQLNQITQQMRANMQNGNSIQQQFSPSKGNLSLLPAQAERDRGKKTLVLDLDETLVHSSFKPIENADIVQPVDIEGKIQHVYVLKRPFCEEFIQRMSIHYEIVMFTASLSKYAEPLYNKLDKRGVTACLLYREHCTFYNGLFVKDMARLGRPLQDVIIIDNSPTSFLFQPENALPSISWYEDKNDRELMEFVPILEKLAFVKDVRPFLTEIVEDNRVNIAKAKEVLNYGRLINPEDDENQQQQLFTPPKQRVQENKKFNSQLKSETGSSLQLQNSQSLSVLSTSIQAPQFSAPKTPKVQSSQSIKRTLEEKLQDQQMISSSSSSVQYSLEQIKRQQMIQQKQQTQIEDIKKRILSNNYNIQQQQQSWNENSKAQEEETQKQENQYKRPHISQPSTDSSRKANINSPNNQGKLNERFGEKNEKENKYSSYSLTSDKKYQDYLQSLQKHQKRSGSQQVETKFKQGITQIEEDITLSTQRTNDRHSNQNEKDLAKNKQQQVNKRAISATVTNRVTNTATQINNNLKQSKLTTTLSPSSTSHALRQTQQNSVEKQPRLGSTNHSQKSSHFNFQQTPDKQPPQSLRIAHTSHSTPKNLATGNSLLGNKATQNQISNSSSKRENSFSALQQRTQDLKKNFANFIKSIESNSTPINTQPPQTTNASTSSTLKIRDNNIKPQQQQSVTGGNKFIQKFEQQSQNENQSNQTKTSQIVKVQPLSPFAQKQALSLQQEQSSNKNHLTYSSIYNKLSQQNLQATQQNQFSSALTQSQGSNNPIRAQQMSSYSQMNGSSSQSQSNASRISNITGSSQNQQQMQQNSSSTVNLIALQMLKHSPFSK